jgi:hypothetical protein
MTCPPPYNMGGSFSPSRGFTLSISFELKDLSQ